MRSVAASLLCVMAIGLARESVAQPTLASIALSKPVVAGCQNSNLLVTLSAPAPAEGLRVDLASTSPLATLNARVQFPAGAISAKVAVRTKPVAARTDVELRATLSGQTLATTLTLRPIGVGRLQLSKGTVPGGTAVLATATLECAAAPGSIDVLVGSSNADAVGPLRERATIATGGKKATFEILTSGVDVRTRQQITATAAGVGRAVNLTTTVPVSDGHEHALLSENNVVRANRPGGVHVQAVGLFDCKPLQTALNVSFVDGSTTKRNKVRQSVRDWTAAGFSFSYVSDANYDADVVISFDGRGGGDRSYVGRCHPRGITMHLPGVGDFSATLSQGEHATILHEFGHALGLLHEHQNPVLGAQWNLKYLREQTGCTGASDVEACIRVNYLHQEGSLNFSVFDPFSIMKYPLNERMFQNVPEMIRLIDPEGRDPEGARFKLFGTNFTLSFMDTHFVSEWMAFDWGGYTAAEDQYLFGNWDGSLVGRPRSSYAAVGDRPAVVRGIHTLFSYDRDERHDFVHAYGNHGDRRLAGDWDGDGRDTVATIRGNCVYYDNNSDSAHDMLQCYGDASNTYLVGDWNGDGRDNIGVIVGNCVNMDTNYDDRHDIQQCYGFHGEPMIVGDWNGDGRDNLAIIRGNCVYKDYNFDGAHDVVHCHGNHGDFYVAGDWDGDGDDNLAVLRGNCLYMDYNNDDRHDAVQCYGNGRRSAFGLGGALPSAAALPGWDRLADLWFPTRHSLDAIRAGFVERQTGHSGGAADSAPGDVALPLAGGLLAVAVARVTRPARGAGARSQRSDPRDG